MFSYDLSSRYQKIADVCLNDMKRCQHLQNRYKLTKMKYFLISYFKTI